MDSLYLNHSEFMSKCKYMKRRKQNHKISYQFFAAPPCTPRRFFERKEIFGFGLRLEGARGALSSLHHALGAYVEGLRYHALGACDYFSLRSKKVRISPQVGLEPTTNSLTGSCSTIELLRNNSYILLKFQ